MFISDFVRALNDSLELNKNVVNALTDILLSSKKTTSIENTPPFESEYFHQKGTSYLYGREPVASDMFDGEAGSVANKAPYPIIEDFNLGETPDILNGRLADKIVTLSSINDTTKLVLGTLSGVLVEYDDAIRKNELATKSKTWKKFKVGEYWPVSDGFSYNSDNNSTCKIETEVQYHTTSKYAFIKLSPAKDVKFHYMTIDVDVIEDMDIPAIFVILDSMFANDGDQFEFRVAFKTPEGYTSQVKWPEILFFDSSYNSNGVPQPSIVHDYEHNEQQVNNSIKIDGVDYYYVTADTLPVLTQEKYNLAPYDRVFVSSAELNGNIINHPGKFDVIKLDSLKGSKYLGYGILEDKYVKTYKNEELLITAELAEDLDALHSPLLSFQQQQQKFVRRNSVSSYRNKVKFNGQIGSSMFYGRPCSFFKPKIANDYSRVEYYADSLEGLDGNIPVQYELNKFTGYIQKPDDNGILFEYELNPSTLNGNILTVRLGHFESSIGLTLQFTGSDMVASFSGVDEDVSFSKTYDGPVKCQVGIINTNGIIYADYSIKDLGGIRTWRVKCTNSNYLDALLASRINNVGVINSTKQQYLTESRVFEYWRPVFTVIVDGSVATGEASVEIKNSLVKYELPKEAYESLVKEYIKDSSFDESDDLYFQYYSSIRWVLDPIVLRPSDIRGFLCAIDAQGRNTYLSNNPQNDDAFKADGLINYRTGFTYNAYKGKVFADSHVQYDPIVHEKENNELSEDVTVLYLASTNTTASQTTLSEPAIVNEVSTVDSTPGKPELYEIPTIKEISVADTEQIDNISAKFGWKVTTYYQSIG
jgi:hypothetical protein